MISGEYPPMQGGVGDFTRELAAALSTQGQPCYVLTASGGRSEPGIEVSNTIRHWNWGSIVQARRWIRANRLDVVNIQFETAAYGMSPFVHSMPALLRNVPIITTFHDLHVPYLFPKAGPIREQALWLLARGSSGVIVTNAQDETRLRTDAHIKRLTMIPIGSNIPTEPPSGYDRIAWRGQLGIPTEALLIGHFGFLNASKGIETLINGFADTLKQGLNARLLMIGGQTGASDPENAAYAAQIEKQIEQLDLVDCVHWTGFVDVQQVSAYLTACDLIALPFKDGVSPRRGSFMAALAHGCPIITTQPAVNWPEVTNAAVLIPPESPQALAAALIALSADPALRARLAASARELAKGYSWQAIAAQTLAFYQATVVGGAESIRYTDAAHAPTRKG